MPDISAAHGQPDSQKIIGLYDRHARAFDRERNRSLFERPWLDRFLRLLPAGGSILDLGCGVGEPIGRYFIESGREVVGVDSSPAMIAVCKNRFPRGTFVEADMRTLSYPRSFSGIIASDSFFHLTPADQRKMFGVFRQHADKGAALIFTSGPAYGVSMGEYHGEPLYHASLDVAEYHALLDQNGFQVVSFALEDPDCGGHTIWLAKMTSPIRPDV
ncbi:class I SAM-dependent DNA methyltransferase [Methylocapsa palsarum]|uniref:Methyltransferase domain-containing protein n=1 Tax=Methylocapsa palsarum TaxID=1612308 RepID=A0A1I3ZN31_9HYPH|nr:class I SAM-dependent methyltransferase [Methylocapsa palsarum]SFK45465.1 Methyltransferase domain-containing protein [Methylocapsa palsarum]